MIPYLSSHISHHSSCTTYYAGPKSRAVVRMFFKIFPKLISHDYRSFFFSQNGPLGLAFTGFQDRRLVGTCAGLGRWVGLRWNLPLPVPIPSWPPDHLPPRRLLRPRVRVRLRVRRRLRWHPHRGPRCHPGGSPQGDWTESHQVKIWGRGTS